MEVKEEVDLVVANLPMVVHPNMEDKQPHMTLEKHLWHSIHQSMEDKHLEDQKQVVQLVGDKKEEILDMEVELATVINLILGVLKTKGSLKWTTVVVVVQIGDKMQKMKNQSIMIKDGVTRKKRVTMSKWKLKLGGESSV